MKVIERIVEFINHKNMSMRAFDNSINVGNGYTSKQFKAKASVGSDVIERIVDEYPELNPYWLVTGHGNKILTEAQQLTNEGIPDYGNTIDQILENKIKQIVKAEMKAFNSKLDNVPSIEQIGDEVRKILQNES